MSKRIPPSAEQIAQALTDHLMNLPADQAFRTVLPILDAQRVIAKAFSTSHAKALDWLYDLAAKDTHPVEMLKIGGAGVVSAALRAGVRPGRLQWKPLAVEYGYTFMTGTPRLLMAWGGGVAEAADGKFDPLAERPADDAVFVAVTKLFQPIIQEYADHYAAKSVADAGEKILQGAAIEHEHGAALAHIRGLLDLAGARHPHDEDELLRVRYSRQGQVTITLVGDAIDQVGELLRQLGVPAKTED